MSPICELCAKEFQSSDALLDHNRAKHPKKKELFTSSAKKKMGWILGAIIMIAIIWFFMSGASKSQPTGASTYADLSFQELCATTGGMWMKMQPTQSGVATGLPACLGCMQRNGDHICEKERYIQDLQR